MKREEMLSHELFYVSPETVSTSALVIAYWKERLLPDLVMKNTKDNSEAAANSQQHFHEPQTPIKIDSLLKSPLYVITMIKTTDAYKIGYYK